MQTATTPATALTVARHLPAYAGPLIHFLERQAQAKRLHELRTALNAAVASPTLFTDTERLLTNDSAYQCEDVAQLALWLRNVERVALEREAGLCLPFADGTRLFLALVA